MYVVIVINMLAITYIYCNEKMARDATPAFGYGPLETLCPATPPYEAGPSIKF
jgi:hypothetical protein